ncbi:MAG: glycosyltransferase [Bacteroidetes bacterium]|nr:glycosyltransferase [Bacteroidota bacterium]
MKAILLINNYPNLASGAMKRYLALYNFIAKERDDYCLIINQEIYDLCRPVNVLNTDKNVFVIRIHTFQKPATPSPASPSGTTSGEPATDFKTRQPGKIRIFLGHSKYFLKLFLFWFSFAIRFTGIIRKYKIFHVYAVWTGGMWAWPLKKILRFRLYYSANGYLYTHMDKSLFYFFDTEYWIFKYADKIDFLSAYMVELLEKKIGKISPLRISVSPNSFISYENFYPEYPKSETVIFMARLYWDKNPLVFLEAVKIFNQSYPSFKNVEFLVLGEGPMEKEVRTYAIANNLVNVHFTGSVARPFEYLRKSKIFVSIQIGNNYPSQSLMEAMACENVIIATDVGETRLLVTENEGVLIPLNANDLANALLKLISNPQLISDLGKNARLSVLTNHSVERFAQYFYQLNEE